MKYKNSEIYDRCKTAKTLYYVSLVIAIVFFLSSFFRTVFVISLFWRFFDYNAVWYYFMYASALFTPIYCVRHKIDEKRERIKNDLPLPKWGYCLIFLYPWLFGAYMAGACLISHIFAYIAAAKLVKIRPLIIAEWEKDPPPFYADMPAKQREKEHEQNVNESSTSLKKCGTNTTVTAIDKPNPPQKQIDNENKEINTMEKLIANKWKQLGTNSQHIYLDCCEKFGWKKELADEFGRQGSLQFARNATNENYDVWALTHSNLNDSNAIRWGNKITEDLLTVTQYNTIKGEENNTKNEARKNLRIVFAKTRLSTGEGYAFLGIYKFVERIPLCNNPDYVAKYVYKQVSKVYPFNIDVVIPSWLKVGEKVTHNMLGQVTVTDLDKRNNAISIEDENSKKYNLNLKNCIEQKVFSPIKKEMADTPSSKLPSFVKVGAKVKHVKYGIVEILSLSEEFIFIQDSNNRVYYVRKEKAHELLKPIHKPFTPGTTIIHKELGRAWVTKVTETTITVIDKNGTPHTLNLDFCYERNLLSEDKE